MALSQTSAKEDKAHIDESLYTIPDAPQVSSDELFSEPPSFLEKALGKVLGAALGKVISAVFDNVTVVTYYVLVIVLGIILAAVWGVLFGIHIFVITWILNPVWKQILIYVRQAYVLYRVVVRFVLDPVFQAVGSMYGAMRLRTQLNVVGITFGTCAADPKSAQDLGSSLDLSPRGTKDTSIGDITCGK